MQAQNDATGDINEDFKDIKGKKVIPRMLCEKLLVHNHVILEHSSKQLELQNLQQYFFEELEEHKLVRMVDVIRLFYLHCEGKQRIIDRPLHLTTTAVIARQVLHIDSFITTLKAAFVSSLIAPLARLY